MQPNTAQPGLVSLDNAPATSVAAPEARPMSAEITPPPAGPRHAEAMTVFVRQAKAYMQHQEWEKAIAACEEALAVAPDVAEAHKLIGNVLQEMGRGIDSMGHYARALLANPAFPEVYANLGSLYARQQEWKDAEEYYRKALALRPESVMFLKPLTKVLEAQGKSEEAMQLFVQRVILEPEAATAAEHFLAGNFFLDEGDENQAIACYHQAVELDESFSQAYRPLADLLEKQGDWQAATLYYRKVLQAGLATEPPQENAETNGSDKAQLQRIPSGHASLQQLLQDAKQVREMNGANSAGQSTDDRSAFAERGRSLGVEATSNPQAVILEQAARYARSGQLQAQESNWPRAIEYYQESLKLNPRQPGVYRELARVLTEIQEPARAAMAWFRAFQLEPDWATAEQHYNLANNLVKQGKLEEGTVCYRQALRLQPELTAAYENLGHVLELQNDPAGAMAAYRQALESDTSVSQAQDLARDSKAVEA